MSKVNLFLQRWSRLKTQTDSPSVPDARPAAPAELPPVDSLTPDSDFSGFLGAGVDAETRQAALKKLFMTDRYRTMDMLDVYVDDYSSPEPLPAEMLDKLEHARTLLIPPDPPVTETQAGQTQVTAMQENDATAPVPESGPDFPAGSSKKSGQS